ncbi:MAG: protein kinase [Ktedonobacteraceae bacterium]|nr:protein kinase [Ktedonobacteraceae bacterium]
MKLWRYGQAVERLGARYRLDGILGSGGMADVCQAWDEREEREVAIKVIKPDQLDQFTLERFQKEAAHASRLHHPHILRTYGGLQLELLAGDQEAAIPYIVMEYAQGGDLNKRLVPGTPYPFDAAMEIFSQICSAVAYAHEQGIIHRDIKPLNILFRRLPDGVEEAVLSDFGLAVEVEASHHTFAGGGTLLYMAPEQIQGQPQPASDIFSLGVLLYRLCAGQLPFRRSLEELRSLDRQRVPLPPGLFNPALPPALNEVILIALSPDPAARYTSALLFWEAVQEAVEEDKTEPHLAAVYPATISSIQATEELDQYEKPAIPDGQGEPAEDTESSPFSVQATDPADDVLPQLSSPIATNEDDAAIGQSDTVDAETCATSAPSSDGAPEENESIPPAPAENEELSSRSEKCDETPSVIFEEEASSNEEEGEGEDERKQPSAASEEEVDGEEEEEPPPVASEEGVDGEEEEEPPSVISEDKTGNDGRETVIVGPVAEEDESSPAPSALTASSGAGEVPATDSEKHAHSRPGEAILVSADDSQLLIQAAENSDKCSSVDDSFPSQETCNDRDDQSPVAASSPIPAADPDVSAQLEQLTRRLRGLAYHKNWLYLFTRKFKLFRGRKQKQLDVDWKNKSITLGTVIVRPEMEKRRSAIKRITTIVIVLFVLGTATFSVIPFAFSNRQIKGPFVPFPTAIPSVSTVTLVPDSKIVTDSYDLQVVDGSSDAARHLIGGHAAVGQGTQSGLVNGTGKGAIPAVSARGTLTIRDSTALIPPPAGQPVGTLVIPAGTVFTGKDGVQVVMDQGINSPRTVPAYTVAAHAVVPGAKGNIAAGDINTALYNNTVSVTNSAAFTGGVDAVPYTFVQQSDVDAYSRTVAPALAQSAQSALPAQIHPGEQTVGGAQCSAPVARTDVPVGDQRRNIPTAQVTVTVTCTQLAYNPQSVKDLVVQLLKDKASNNPGSHYALVGDVTIKTNAQGSTIHAEAKGRWAYQFSDEQKQAFSSLIAGKTVGDAIALLKSVEGVVDVSIQGGSRLPSDPAKIVVVVKDVAGA